MENSETQSNPRPVTLILVALLGLAAILGTLYFAVWMPSNAAASGTTAPITSPVRPTTATKPVDLGAPSNDVGAAGASGKPETSEPNIPATTGN